MLQFRDRGSRDLSPYVVSEIEDSITMNGSFCDVKVCTDEMDYNGIE